MELSCRKCGAGIRATDLRLDAGIAICSFCGTVMRLALAAPAAKAAVPLPARFTEARSSTGITWTWRWFTPVLLFLLFFAIAWDSFLIFWYAMGIGSALNGAGAEIIIMFVFPIAHVAVGAWLTYFTLCGFVNSTSVSISRSGVEVRHGPLPWRGNLTLAAKEIEQLFCKVKSARNKDSETLTYEVHALVRGGGQKPLLTGLEDPDQALFIEQQIEAFLGIKDAPVAGQI